VKYCLRNRVPKRSRPIHAGECRDET
jgi:hypothetical protein